LFLTAFIPFHTRLTWCIAARPLRASFSKTRGR